MWKKFMRSLMLWLVSSNSILFQHLFFFILGASHSFISKAFVDRNGFPTENIGCPIKVSSPGGDMIVSLGCRDLVIEFGKHKFLVSYNPRFPRTGCNFGNGLDG